MFARICRGWLLYVVLVPSGLSMAQGGDHLSGLMQVHPGRTRAVTSSAEDFKSNYDRRT